MEVFKKVLEIFQREDDCVSGMRCFFFIEALCWLGVTMYIALTGKECPIYAEWTYFTGAMVALVVYNKQMECKYFKDLSVKKEGEKDG